MPVEKDSPAVEDSRAVGDSRVVEDSRAVEDNPAEEGTRAAASPPYLTDHLGQGDKEAVHHFSPQNQVQGRKGVEGRSQEVEQP